MEFCHQKLNFHGVRVTELSIATNASAGAISKITLTIKLWLLKVGKQLATLDYAGFSDAGLHFENPSEHLPLKDFAAMRVAAIRQSLYTHKTNMREDLRIQNHQIAIQLYKVSLVQKYFSFCILFHYF